MLPNEQLSEIERRHKDRKAYSDLIPKGPYSNNSFAFVYNHCEWSPERPGDHPKKKVGVLIRPRDWFKSINMDANLGIELIKEYGQPCGVLGEYIAHVCTQPVEEDIDALLAEVKRLKEQVGE